MSEKKVNQSAVDLNSQSISAVSEETILFNDIVADDMSTISAKYNSLRAVGKSQDLMRGLSKNLKNESKNIKSIGTAFKDFDNAITVMVKNI